MKTETIILIVIAFVVTRREKVLNEIRRPLFALLAERCTYLPYDEVNDLRGQKHLSHMSDNVLDDCAVKAQDTD